VLTTEGLFEVDESLRPDDQPLQLGMGTSIIEMKSSPVAASWTIA
jgi:hypothetical protein